MSTEPRRGPDALRERLRGRRIAVLGAARSGVAAANLLVELGLPARLSDPKSAAQLAGTLADLDPRVELVTGRNALEDADLLVVSPGIPPAAPVWGEVAARELEVISEIELGALAARAPMVAITGTDGKTTTTAIVGALFAAADRPHRVLGNIGQPLCSQVLEVPPEGALVVEVSCFQLLHVREFRPRVALLLNLAEDHLDYHPTFEHYVAAKLRVFAAQGEGDTAVVSLDDPGVRRELRSLAPGLRRWGFSALGPAAPGVGLEDGWLVDRTGPEPVALLRRSDSPLVGDHNSENLAAAAAAGLAMGLSHETVAAALRAFSGLPHRLETLRTLDGVTWINDSKATSPHAALAGLRALQGEVLLIAGGIDKGLLLGEWADGMIERCAGVVSIGQLAPRLDEELLQRGAGTAGKPWLHRAQSLGEAVQICRAAARAGQSVLLGPGCSSFDMFRNYEERGEVFRSLVAAL